MSDETMKIIETKIDKGEELTPEEEREIMSMPNDLPGENAKPKDPDAEGAFDDIEDMDEGETGDKEPEEDKDPKEPEEDKVPKDPKDPEEDKDPEGLNLVELELAKPEGEQNLEGFNNSDKALFWEGKRKARSQQLLEEENALLKATPPDPKVLEPKKPVEGQEEQPAADVVMTDFLKGKDAEDFVSVGELVELIPKLANQKKVEALPPVTTDIYLNRYIAMCDKEASQMSGIKDDYVEVMACSEDVINNGRFSGLYQRKIATALNSGQNPALLMYSLIKGDPDFPNAVVRARVVLGSKGKVKVPDVVGDKKTKEKEALIAKNKKKIKTTAHQKGTGESGDDQDLTAQQLARMSDEDYQALPKKDREYYHKKYAL